MHTALRRGKLFQIDWQVKAFLHCRLSTLWKRSKPKQMNKQKNKTLREVHESDGNATVMPPSYAPDSTGHAVTAGRESSGHAIIFILAKIA